MSDPQQIVVLTPHPLQRVGAFALASLAECDHPANMTPADFVAASKLITDVMADAATKPDGKGDGAFFLKTSFSFFPNSPINHSTRSKGGKDPAAGVRQWRTMPDPESWPGVPCALCGRRAVAFYGNTDMALAASTSHRNTVPDGHAGTALCWPCVTSFHALPYGCKLTGGQSSVVHSYDDQFLSDVVDDQVAINEQHVTLGHPVGKSVESARVTAIKRLRSYGGPLSTGIELLVFTNFNGKAALEVSKLDHPTSLWLRSTGMAGARGWRELVQAHRGQKASGLERLAYNLFGPQQRVIGAAAGYLERASTDPPMLKRDAGDLASICRSYLTKVLNVNETDQHELDVLAEKLADQFVRQKKSAGQLKGFRVDFNSKRRRNRLVQEALGWLLDEDTQGSLISPRQFTLLEGHERSWLYRNYLLIALFEQLAVKGFNPTDAAEVASELADEPIEEDSEGDQQ